MQLLIILDLIFKFFEEWPIFKWKINLKLNYGEVFESIQVHTKIEIRNFLKSSWKNQGKNPKKKIRICSN